MNSYDRGPRAKMFIPCPENRCHVVKNGKAIKSRLQLRVMHSDGLPIEEPYYLCERKDGLSPCYYSYTSLPANRVGDDRYVWEAHRQIRPKKKKGDEFTERDMETCV